VRGVPGVQLPAFLLRLLFVEHGKSKRLVSHRGGSREEAKSARRKKSKARDVERMCNWKQTQRTTIFLLSSGPDGEDEGVYVSSPLFRTAGSVRTLVSGTALTSQSIFN